MDTNVIVNRGLLAAQILCTDVLVNAFSIKKFYHFFEDIDECELSLFYCGTKAKCRNTIGSYFCDCFNGYEISNESKQCVDMNECLYNPCDSNALCTNTDGSFYCKCNDGYIGNGIECHSNFKYNFLKII